MRTIAFTFLALLATQASAISLLEEPSVFRCVTKKTSVDGTSQVSRFWSVGTRKKGRTLHNFDGKFLGELGGKYFSVTLGENEAGRLIMYISESNAKDSYAGTLESKDVDDSLATTVEYSDSAVGKITFQCERAKP